LLKKLKKMLNKNKSGQLSDAMTWIVATLIIIVILVVFVFAANVIAESKSLPSLEEINLEDSEDKIDFIEMKNKFAFNQNSDNQLKIEVWLSEVG